MKKTFSRKITGACALLGLMSGTVLAVDGKVYSGGTCTPRDSSAQFQRGSLTGRIENVSTIASMDVACPVLKDRMKGDGLITDGRTAVYVINRNAGFTLQCQMLVFGEDKSAGPVKQETVSTSTAGAAVQVLTFSSAVGNAKGHYELSCILPPAVGSFRSAIHAYSVTEKD